MDPILETVIWGVVWLFAGSIGSAIVYLIFIGLGALMSSIFDADGAIVPFVVLGWLGAIAWQGFVLIQVILHAVHLIQLLGA